MIRRHMIMSAAAATFALASCSGGDNDPTPTPTPTSTVTPTPTPTASPTYVTFPLTTATEFNTINSSTNYTGDPTAGAVTLGVSSTETLSTRVRLATAPAIATGTFVAVEATQESRFTTTNATVQPTPAVEEYVFRTDDTATAGKFAQLEFLNNTIASQVTSNTDLALTNVSYATWWRGDSTADKKTITSTVWGYQTVLSDMPTTGTQAYTSAIRGRLVSVSGSTTSVLRVVGTVTTSVNFGTGQVDITLSLSTIPAAGGAAVPYTTATAQGAIPVGQNQFNGSFTSGLTGTIAGGFFGSQGKELGIAIGANGTVGGGNQRLVGVILGRKP